ncbi:hypothetical protein ACRYCC_28285 [Actinomadura scrupuli]|uniref:hypothetical protein n=1 Tax=Actinomadura scrupuli TaxID=559629 RepID=UPI003D97B1EE
MFESRQSQSNRGRVDSLGRGCVPAGDVLGRRLAHRGRDSALIPPHLALYGSVAAAGLIVVNWGLRALIRSRSLSAVLRHPPLLLVGLGGSFTLASAPVDAAWHAAYGRDAVLWSPPHMLIILASTTMAIGVLAGLRPTRTGIVETAVAALVLGSLTMAVVEYDTDVPQFQEVFYLPVLLGTAVFAAAVVQKLIPRRYAVTGMVAIYGAARLVIALTLWGLGHSAPDMPMAILGLAAMDLPLRTSRFRLAAGAAGVSLLAWAAAVLGISSLHPGAIGMVAFPTLLLFAALLATGRRQSRALETTAVLLAAAVLALEPASPARAHDPGQGTPIASALFTVTTDQAGLVQLIVGPSSDCDQFAPQRVVARRAGQTMAAPLIAVGGCRFSGVLRLPRTGRWFVYADFMLSGRPAEGWLPVLSNRAGVTTKTGQLYRPAEQQGVSAGEIGSGVAIYASGLLLLGLALHLIRRVPHQPGGPT